MSRSAWYAAGCPWLDESVAAAPVSLSDPLDEFVASSPSDDRVAIDAVPVIQDDSVADHSPVALDGFVAAVSLTLPPDDPVAASLLRRVRLLPGGRDPDFLSSLARLVADAPAAREAWGSCDPQLAALLNADD